MKNKNSSDLNVTTFENALKEIGRIKNDRKEVIEYNDVRQGPLSIVRFKNHEDPWPFETDIEFTLFHINDKEFKHPITLVVIGKK